MRTALGSGLYTIGFDSHGGAALGDAGKDHAVTPGEMEELLHAAGRPLLFLDLSRLPADHWLRAPRTGSFSIEGEPKPRPDRATIAMRHLAFRVDRANFTAAKAALTAKPFQGSEPQAAADVVTASAFEVPGLFLTLGPAARSASSCSACRKDDMKRGHERSGTESGSLSRAA